MKTKQLILGVAATLLMATGAFARDFAICVDMRVKQITLESQINQALIHDLSEIKGVKVFFTEPGLPFTDKYDLRIILWADKTTAESFNRVSRQNGAISITGASDKEAVLFTALYLFASKDEMTADCQEIANDVRKVIQPILEAWSQKGNQ